MHHSYSSVVPTQTQTTAKVRRGLTSNECLVTNPAETVVVSKHIYANCYIIITIRVILQNNFCSTLQNSTFGHVAEH